MRMIERVARAICKAQTQSEQVWQAFLPEAIAAIEAMREPTDEMVEAQERAVSSSEYAALRYDVPDDELLRIYTAMIDAALTDHRP